MKLEEEPIQTESASYDEDWIIANHSGKFVSFFFVADGHIQLASEGPISDSTVCFRQEANWNSDRRTHPMGSHNRLSQQQQVLGDAVLRVGL